VDNVQNFGHHNRIRLIHSDVRRIFSNEIISRQEVVETTKGIAYLRVFASMFVTLEGNGGQKMSAFLL
jgi:hypothetical protein